MFLGDLWREIAASLFGSRGRTHPVTTGMSGAPVFSVAIVDDVAAGIDRRRLSTHVRALASAERMVERGWDWDADVPDALFYGQTRSVGPAEARSRVVATEGELQRAADLFGAEVDWSRDLA